MAEDRAAHLQAQRDAVRAEKLRFETSSALLFSFLRSNVKQCDLTCLQPGEWLMDEIMTFALE